MYWNFTGDPKRKQQKTVGFHTNHFLFPDILFLKLQWVTRGGDKGGEELWGHFQLWHFLFLFYSYFTLKISSTLWLVLVIFKLHTHTDIHTHTRRLNLFMNCPTSAQGEDTFPSDGLYLHQVRAPGDNRLTDQGAWMWGLQSQSLQCRLPDVGQLLLHQLPCPGVSSGRLTVLFTPQYSMLNIKANNELSRPGSKCFMWAYPGTNLTFLWISRTRVWGWHQTAVRWDSSSSYSYSPLPGPRTPGFS